MEMTPGARLERFFWRVVIFLLVLATCAGGCTACVVKNIYAAGQPLPLPCGSQNLHGEHGDCYDP